MTETASISELSNISSTEVYASVIPHSLAARPHGKYDFLSRIFERWLTSREIKILSLTKPHSFTRVFVYGLIALAALITVPMIIPLLSIKDTHFFEIVPPVALMAICLFSSQQCSSLFKNKMRMSPSPQISYFPISYKEVIRLHCKTIAFTALWNIPLLLAGLWMIRQHNEEIVRLPFSYSIFVIYFYFCTQYLAIYSYHQPPNIISKVTGLRFYKISLSLLAIIGSFTLIFVYSSLASGLHINLIYYATLAILAITATFGFIHYKSYQSMQLDI